MRCGAVTLSLLALGCAPQPTPSTLAPDQPDPCGLTAGSPNQLDTLTVALLEPVDLGNATAPANDSERLLFRNLFENLIRVDCEGTVRPGLARYWTADSVGRGWTLTLREGAAFPGSGPISASDVAAMLRVFANRDSASAGAFGIDSAFELDDRRLRVLMRGGADSLPRFLADPALVVTNGLASGGGSGEGSLLIPRQGKLPVIEFRFPLQRDARDALDREADLVITRDPVLVDYVSNRAEFTTFPLPWSRTYLLMEPGVSRGDLLGALDTVSVRKSLAKDAVRASSRAPEPPYWWSDHRSCQAASPLRSDNASSRVVYRKDDDIARGLAERIVALASPSAGLRAVGIEAPELAIAVRGGSDRAYVMGVPRQSLAPCRDVYGLPAGFRFLPLIESRAYAIVRNGAPPMTVEWDGTIRMVER